MKTAITKRLHKYAVFADGVFKRHIIAQGLQVALYYARIEFPGADELTVVHAEV